MEVGGNVNEINKLCTSAGCSHQGVEGEYKFQQAEDIDRWKLIGSVRGRTRMP